MKIRTIIISAVLLGTVAIGGLVAANGYTDTRNTGNVKEQSLSARYKMFQAEYSQDRQKALDEMGVAGEKRDAIDKILTDAIGGRYNKGTGVDQHAVGLAINAVTEAYPDTSGTNIYDMIMGTIERLRTNAANRQKEMASEIESFDNWRTTGSLLHPLWVRMVGFPNDELVVRSGDKVWRGKDAYEKMSTVIMTSDSQQIFNTNTDQPLFPPKK